MSQNLKQRIIAEIQRELDKRYDAYPKMILKNTLTRDEANLYFLRLKAAQKYIDSGIIGHYKLPDMLSELKRELVMRQNYYKKLISRQQMDAITAATKTMLIQEAVTLISSDIAASEAKQGEFNF
jgi:hypothetical protein